MSDGFGDLFYFEDHLPPGQDPIDTSSMTTARAFLGFLMQSRARTGYSAMGVITGRSGIGKTIAVHTYLDKFLPRPHTGRPACTRVKVQHRSSALALARTLLGVLGDRPYGHNVYKVTDEAALAILRNDLELVVIDEADRLTADSFEVLRHIYDRTRCPIVLVGLPQILDVITRQEKFAGRVTMHLRFPPWPSARWWRRSCPVWCCRTGTLMPLTAPTVRWAPCCGGAARRPCAACATCYKWRARWRT